MYHAYGFKQWHDKVKLSSDIQFIHTIYSLLLTNCFGYLDNIVASYTVWS